MIGSGSRVRVRRRSMRVSRTMACAVVGSMTTAMTAAKQAAAVTAAMATPVAAAQKAKAKQS